VSYVTERNTQHTAVHSKGPASSCFDRVLTSCITLRLMCRNRTRFSTCRYTKGWQGAASASLRHQHTIWWIWWCSLSLPSTNQYCGPVGSTKPGWPTKTHTRPS